MSSVGLQSLTTVTIQKQHVPTFKYFHWFWLCLLWWENEFVGENVYVCVYVISCDVLVAYAALWIKCQQALFCAVLKLLSLCFFCVRWCVYAIIWGVDNLFSGRKKTPDFRQHIFLFFVILVFYSGWCSSLWSCTNTPLQQHQWASHCERRSQPASLLYQLTLQCWPSDQHHLWSVCGQSRGPRLW